VSSTPISAAPFALPEDVRLAAVADVPALRRLVNAAYQELAELGLNFTGTYQDDEVTRERMREAEVLLLHRDDDLVASISLAIRPVGDGSDQCLYVNQLAVRPDRKRRGLGAKLTEDNVERYVAIFMNDRLESVPMVMARIDADHALLALTAPPAPGELCR
jgi:hypothetical protein